jgi:3-oxoacyl-[acyl-carrier protein] reductase
MAPLNGKVAIVSGSSRGIGRAIVERFAQDGAAVVVNYARSAGEAREVVAGIEAKRGKAIAIQADTSSEADIRRLFRETLATFGHVDIVVNNAGAPRLGEHNVMILGERLGLSPEAIATLRHGDGII